MHISDLLWNTISYNDYQEDYYHAFLAGVFVGRGYNIESNKEKGLGRPDIILNLCFGIAFYQKQAKVKKMI